MAVTVVLLTISHIMPYSGPYKLITTIVDLGRIDRTLCDIE